MIIMQIIKNQQKKHAARRKTGAVNAGLVGMGGHG